MQPRQQHRLLLHSPLEPGGSAAAIFVAAIRTLIRARFDENVAKHVAKKGLGGKDSRFMGNEDNAATIFAKLVPARQKAFTAEGLAFTTIFTLDDATVTMSVESNRLLFSTFELLVHPTSPAVDRLEASSLAFPQDGKRVLLEFALRLLHTDAPFQGTSDLLGVKVLANEDPQEAIADFSGALTAARHRGTLMTTR
ncbi:hypothetical protein CYMTET_32787 [Cymbomonas tetramitiformis]|uniref:Uncharacterized protein n=1 Tax=Cymbomonas tetramitiformis TaxID=36881 RepID=A0AAE0KRV1_9CHLO|nr:hypothetical protein CYMTET_32787 [Cymbomonas tetramitiformis]